MSVRCYICDIERPDVSKVKEALIKARDDNDEYFKILKEWESKGEGWYIFSSWEQYDKIYFCPKCARMIRNDVRERHRLYHNPDYDLIEYNPRKGR